MTTITDREAEQLDDLIFQARMDKTRIATTTVSVGASQALTQALHRRLRQLRVHWFDRRIRIHDPWGRGISVNFDPDHLGVTLNLKLSKVAVRRLGMQIHD